MSSGNGGAYLYHDPCHSPMKQHNPLAVTSQLMGGEVRLSDRCCGEAGTLGVSRPDIANQLRYRKAEEIRDGMRQLTGADRAVDGNVRMLTSCPACVQGLNRYRESSGLEVSYMVE